MGNQQTHYMSSTTTTNLNENIRKGIIDLLFFVLSRCYSINESYFAFLFLLFGFILVYFCSFYTILIFFLNTPMPILFLFCNFGLFCVFVLVPFIFLCVVQ